MSIATQMILLEKYGPRLTIANLAGVLCISEKTVRNRIASREFGIPLYVEGGVRYADYRDVAQYLDECRERARIPA